MGFFRQEYWRGPPYPSPGDPVDPQIKPVSLMSPAFAARFFTTSATWEVPLTIRGTQTKTTIRYHLTSVRMTVIKKTTNNKCSRGQREKGPLIHCWQEYKLAQTLWKITWRFLKKFLKKNYHMIQQSLFWVYPEEIKTGSQRYMNSHIHCNIIYNSQAMEVT